MATAMSVNGRTTEDSDFQGDSRANEERTPVAFGEAINQFA